MKFINWLAYILVVVGGLNWGLTAVGFNLVEKILGTGSVTKVVYILVGLAALWALYTIRPVEKKMSVTQPVM
jgi:uncharacterized protein